MKFILIYLLMFPVLLFGQFSKSLKIYQLFNTADITSNSCLVLTDADTVVSKNLDWTSNSSGNLRVSVGFDTVSGSGNETFLDIGYRILETGITTFDWKYAVIDSFGIADDHTSKTYSLGDVTTYPFFRDPVIAITLRFRQTGTQVNRIYPGIIKYIP